MSDGAYMTVSAKDNKVLLLIMALLVPLSGIGVDIYAPSLPFITKQFIANESIVKLTITVYVFGYGIGQLIIGTLTDTLGRKRPLLLCTIIYIVVSYLATRSPSISILLMMRFLQGFFVAATGVVAKTMVADCFDGERRAVAANVNTIVWALGPILAPVIGGYLQNYFNWHYSFYFLIGYACVLLFLIANLLPETLLHRHPLNLARLRANYQTVLSNGPFWAGLLICSIFAGIIYCFNLAGPFLIQVVMGYSPIDFGHFVLFAGLSWFLGNLVNRILLAYFRQYNLVLFAVICSLVIVTVMLLLATLGSLNIYALLLPVIGILFFGAIAFSNAMGICLSIFPQMAGTAAAIMGSFFVVGGGLMSAIASLLHSKTLMPLSILYFILIVLCLIVTLSLLKPKAATA